MAIQFICPGCGHALHARDEITGSRVKCPRCAQTLTVPQVSAAPAAGPTAAAPRSDTRQRMYLFERAYVDYWVRLSGFSQALLGRCRGVWEWFWDGPGAVAIEWILRTAIVLSGLIMGGLYIRYELREGRSFSLGMLAVFGIILLYVWIVLSAWKAPVHWGARLVAGLAAAGSVT